MLWHRNRPCTNEQHTLTTAVCLAPALHNRSPHASPETPLGWLVGSSDPACSIRWHERHAPLSSTALIIGKPSSSQWQLQAFQILMPIWKLRYHCYNKYCRLLSLTLTSFIFKKVPAEHLGKTAVGCCSANNSPPGAQPPCLGAAQVLMVSLPLHQRSVKKIYLEGWDLMKVSL